MLIIIVSQFNLQSGELSETPSSILCELPDLESRENRQHQDDTSSKKDNLDNSNVSVPIGNASESTITKKDSQDALPKENLNASSEETKPSNHANVETKIELFTQTPSTSHVGKYVGNIEDKIDCDTVTIEEGEEGEEERISVGNVEGIAAGIVPSMYLIEQCFNQHGDQASSSVTNSREESERESSQESSEINLSERHSSLDSASNNTISDFDVEDTVSVTDEEDIQIEMGQGDCHPNVPGIVIDHVFVQPSLQNVVQEPANSDSASVDIDSVSTSNSLSDTISSSDLQVSEQNYNLIITDRVTRNIISSLQTENTQPGSSNYESINFTNQTASPDMEEDSESSSLSSTGQPFSRSGTRQESRNHSPDILDVLSEFVDNLPSSVPQEKPIEAIPENLVPSSSSSMNIDNVLESNATPKLTELKVDSRGEEATTQSEITKENDNVPGSTSPDAKEVSGSSEEPPDKKMKEEAIPSDQSTQLEFR